MKFSVITPTCKRADLLTRAVRSLTMQTYRDWEMIIINDSPQDRSYDSFASSINDPRIRYLVNDRNMGVNFSRNRALESVSADSKWVVFLDDDDYLAPDALATLHELALTHPHTQWFLTNRAYKDGTSVTKTPRSDSYYSYAKDYLIMRTIKGDATHAIGTHLIHNTRFLRNIKQGEEWFFFYQIGRKTKLFYHDHNSTITDGYDREQGLNFRKRDRKERLKTLLIIIYEAIPLKLVYKPSFVLYTLMRMVRLVY